MRKKTVENKLAQQYTICHLFHHFPLSVFPRYLPESHEIAVNHNRADTIASQTPEYILLACEKRKRAASNYFTF